jgi:hypothetical protein
MRKSPEFGVYGQTVAGGTVTPPGEVTGSTDPASDQMFPRGTLLLPCLFTTKNPAALRQRALSGFSRPAGGSGFL